ncbi:MAG: hypothetical protein ABIL58_04760 [Pseudomonadota bacterium]
MKKIILFTAVFALVLGGTALAADWNFYGSSRMSLFNESQSKDLAANPLTTNSDNRTTQFYQQGNSRIGANVAAGDVKGRCEYGPSVNVRLLYGTWHFGSGEMSVGTMYNPTYYGLSNQVLGTKAGGDQNLLGFGAPFSRLPAIEFKFGGFKVAAVSPSTGTVFDPTATFARANVRATLPKIELAYNGAFGPVNLHVSGGWNSVDFYNAADNTKAVTSMIGNLMLKYSGGPFMVGGSFQYAKNVGNYNTAASVNPVGTVTTAIWTGTELKDTTTMGYTLVAGFTVNDMVGLEAGVGYTVNSYDSSVATNDDPAMSYYFQVPLTLADGVFIIPEISVFDYMEDSAKAKEGNQVLLGAKFQINF